MITKISAYIMPFVILIIVGYGMYKKSDNYDNFVNGAEDGMRTVVSIAPTLIGLMVAVGVLRASGFLDFGGNMNFCITIRTMIKKQDRVYLQAGAGIVADSIPENEYMECCNKVMALAKTVIKEEQL